MMIDDQNLQKKKSSFFLITSIDFGNILWQMDAYEVTGGKNECSKLTTFGLDYHHICVV